MCTPSCSRRTRTQTRAFELFAPAIVPLLVADYSPEKQQLVVVLTRILLIQPIFLGVSGVMMGILSESEKFCWFFCNTSVEGAPGRATPIPGKTKRGQHLREKLLCSCAIPHPQINVIEQSCFHR